LSGGFDTTVRLWKVSSGKCIRTFKGHWKEVESVALSADGQRAISAGGWDHTLRVWEVRSGKCLRIIEGRTEKVSAVALSADGRWAFSGNRDGTLRLWDLSTGECIRTFEGHTNSVTSVALSLDGRWALSGSEDKTIRLWELEWDYDFPEQRDWDDSSGPYLDIFLSLHCAVGEDGFSRVGKPAWTEGDFQNLLVDLQYRGYGWLRPEGVRRQLEKMAAEWQVPPPHREK
jgi:WD40 repeat protein